MEIRQASWENVGVEVNSLTNINEVLTRAKLNYEVEKAPIFLENKTEIIGKYATKKVGTNEIFGIVGTTYKVCQNKEAFDFVNYIESEVKFVKAGQTNSGIVYVITKLPDSYILGDQMTPYIIFQNSHDGKGQIRAAITPLRILCQNQFNLSFKKAENVINIRHSNLMEGKIEEGRKVLKTAAEYMKTFNKLAEKLVDINIKGKEEMFVSKFYKVESDMSSRIEDKIIGKQLNLLQAYTSEDNQNFKGTAWGMVNAYADILTHTEPLRKTGNWQESQFVKATLKPSDMPTFINMLLEVA